MIIIARVKKPLTAVLGLAWSFTVFLFVYLISRPRDAAAAVVDSLSVCASKLIPSLFPFMVLTNLICSTGLADIISRAIGGAFARATGIPASGAPVFLLGSLGGFPVGAVAARRLADNGELSKNDAARLIAFSNNAGLAFCVGGIGSLFGGSAVGWKLWAIQLGAAILIALISADRGKKAAAKPLSRQKSTLSAGEILGAFADSVTSAALAMLKICAFAVFFGTLGDVICRIFPDFPACIAASFCELTLAARLSAKLGSAGLPICAFALGFAGFSVHSQVAAVLLDSGISMRRFFVSKLAQGFVSALITCILC